MGTLMATLIICWDEILDPARHRAAVRAGLQVALAVDLTATTLPSAVSCPNCCVARGVQVDVSSVCCRLCNIMQCTTVELTERILCTRRSSISCADCWRHL